MAVMMQVNGEIKDEVRGRSRSKTRKMLKKPGTFDASVLNVISTPLEEGLGESGSS